MGNKQKVSLGKQILFTGVFIGLIAGIFLLAEVVAGVLSLGVSTQPFEEVSGKPGYLRDNRDEFVKKYMAYTDPTGLDLVPNLFRKTKAPGALRGVVIGESTPQGVPYGVNQSFPKLAEIYLNQAGKEVEILNIAASAMTSFYVKDVARKVVDYQPDFVVIYSGHNEYYGTISVSTGNDPAYQDLYLQLKESRIFQSLFNLASAKPAAGSGALMARQFAGRTFPSQGPMESKVRTIYLDNLKAAVNTLTSRGIRVFIMKPVSNLISFPPFRGAGEEVIKADILALTEMLKAGILTGDDALQLEKMASSYPDSAHIRWLQGQQSLRNGDLDQASGFFYQAKDLDLVPFRARSGLITDLETWAVEAGKANDLITWVDTGEILGNPDGLMAFSWMYFIDQLHFNRRGHYKVAAGLAEAIAGAYQIPLEDQSALKLPVYTPWDEFMAALRMARLALEAPYKDMVIPLGFQVADHVEAVNPFLVDAALTGTISQADSYDNPLYYLNSLFLENKDFASWEYYLSAEVWKNPGSPGPYFERANFLAGLETRRDSALKDWKMAVQLSEDPEAMKKEIRTKMEASGMLSWWDRFEKSLKVAD